MGGDRGPERLVRPDLAGAAAYQPIRPLDVLSESSGISAERIVKLDGNENPYGCSPRVRRALAEFERYHIYPDPEQVELRRALQGYAGVDMGRIVAGAGSDELIDNILRMVLDPGDEVVNCPPTFGMYAFSTGVCAGSLVTVPRDECFGVDAAAVRAAATPRTKVAFLASPNNPTGNCTNEKTVRDLLDLGILVVVDEAYYEFSGRTVMPLTAVYDNLIVLRTFSKWAGLAGLRVGYGVFAEPLARHIMRIKQPYNVNVAAQVAALQSLADLEYLRRTIDLLKEERTRLQERLQQLDFLRPYPSEANFILVRVLRGEANAIGERLKARGIFLRHFDTPGLRDCLRISVGKPEHTDALVQALAEVGPA